MKKTSLLACVLMLNIGLFAQTVDINEAKNIAKNYLLMHRDNASIGPLTVSEQHINYGKSGEVLSYIFNFEEGGFVIVAGDKRTVPVLAYSTSNTFPIDNKNHPASIFVEDYGNAIEQIKTTDAKMEVSPQWNALATGKQHKAITKTVGPLLTSKWNQTKYYNALCPADGTAGTSAADSKYDWHVPNGCVALAMAQIMYYHRYPRRGKGSSLYSLPRYGELSANYGETVYDYEAMADVADGYGYSDAIARLIYHAGVSVEMGYAPNGSGSLSENALKAFSKYFLYNVSSSLMGGKDNPENVYSWWKDTIRQSLDKKLPVYYAACRQGNASETDPDGCHAFVCDGYKIDDTDPNADMFHFNLGWGGSANGFYTLPTIGQSGMGTFTLNARIIINIEPKTDDNFFTGQDTLTATYGSFNDGSGRLNYRDNTNCSWLISPQEGRGVTQIELKVASFTLADGDSVKIFARNSSGLDSLVTTLGGTIAQGTNYTIKYPQVLVVFTSFTSNDSLKKDGFTFNYSSTIPVSYCANLEQQTRITTKEGSIEDGSGTSDYYSDPTPNDNRSCHWAIAPSGMGNQVRFAFSHFDLAQGDVVEIFPYSNTSTDKIPSAAWGKVPDKTFSIEDKPTIDRVYTFGAPTVLIRFRTDNKVTATGFRIYWNEGMGIQENNSAGLAWLSIYPNPANDIMTVNLTTAKEENVQMTVYDILGKVIYSIPPMQISGQHEENIDVSNFAQGLYLLRIGTSEGMVMKKIFVK
jgi:hypothetical protein